MFKTLLIKLGLMEDPKKFIEKLIKEAEATEYVKVLPKKKAAPKKAPAKKKAAAKKAK